MADDDKTQEDVKQAEEAAKEAEKSAEKAEEAKEEAQESAEQAQEAEKKIEGAAKEVKEQKPSQPSEPSEPSKPKVKVSAKLEKIIGEIEKLQVLELSELVKALEEKFGVTAAPQVAVAPSGQAAPGGGDEGASEQTTFNVILAESGANKISVIKAIRELVPTLGLKEAKDLVDAAPKQVLEGVNKETANEAKQKLETAGGKVELK